MKILVTGGMGYIGSHVVIELITAGHDVAILDNLANSKREVLDRIFDITGVRPEFFEADLLDYKAMRAIFDHAGFEAVFHFAGLKAVGESVEEPLLYYENNVGGTVNLLKVMREFKVPKLVFSSSATVYKASDEMTALSETTPTGQDIPHPYGWTKFMIEKIIMDFAAAWSEFSGVILRYFNPIGNHESGLIGEDPNGRPNNLMPIIMKVAKGEPGFSELSIFGNDYPTEDGTCVRDYVHVMDLAEGHIAAMRALLEPGVSIFNLGTGRGTSVLEMVAAFEEASGRRLPTKLAPRRAGDVPVLRADVVRAQEVLGWQAKRTVADAMRDTLAFLNAQ